MFDEKSQQVVRVMTFLDLSLTIMAFMLAFGIRELFFPGNQGELFSHIALVPFILALLLFILPYFGAYEGPRSSNVLTYSWSVTRGLTASITLLLTLLYLLQIQYVSRMVIVIFAGLEFFVLVGVRALVVWYFRNSLKQGENYLKVLVIGTGERAKTVSEGLRKRTEWGIDIIGHLDPDPSRVGMSVLKASVIGSVHDISKVLKENVVDEVILAIPRTMIEDVEEIAYACQEEGVKLRMMADVFDLEVARWSLTELGKIPLLTLEPIALDERKLLVKRAMDLVLVLMAMPLILPVMLLAAIAIKIDSPGPVFFVQERVGLKKRIFRMLKFRSMCVGSEAKLKELEHLNEAQGPIFKMKNDPRVTRVGKFIRKTSIDELPQLFNVLTGEMSLVGPRPMSLRDVNLFDKGIQRKRFSVKPGLTCIWQISGRSNLPFTKWLELDLSYIENWSLGLDIKILFKTIPVVLGGSGAV